MTLARAALALSALFLVFMLGLATAPTPPQTVQPSHALRIAGLRLDPPGPAAASAASQSGSAPEPARTTPGPAVAARAPVVAAPPPPAPPPPEVLLRQAVAAVTEEGGRLGLVMTGSSGRRLHEGDDFMGWRLASVTRSSAVLTRGRERRETAFFAASRSSAGPAPLPGAVSTPAPPSAAPGAPPTAAEFFRGFKG